MIPALSVIVLPTEKIAFYMEMHSQHEI